MCKQYKCNSTFHHSEIRSTMPSTQYQPHTFQPPSLHSHNPISSFNGASHTFRSLFTFHSRARSAAISSPDIFSLSHAFSLTLFTTFTTTATPVMTAIPSPHPLPFKPSPSPSHSASPTTTAPTSTSPSPSHSHHPSLTSPTSPPPLPDIFQDLEARFLLNLPDSELSSFPRLFFQLQQAHWFYCDFYYDRWPHQLPPYNNLKAFCSKFFSTSTLLSSQLRSFEGLYESFTSYLHSVPVCGMILLNGAMDRVVMVRGWKGNTWSFPKGKIDANESELACAVRECREEVGYEVGEGVVGEGDWIEAAMNGKSVKLFMVSGVDESYHFETRTRKEISGIEWVDIATLPSYKDNRMGGGGGGGGDEEKKRKFWNVMPFVDELRRWIGNKKKGKPNQRRNKQQQQQQQNSKPIKPPPSHPIPIQPTNSLSVASSPHHAGQHVALSSSVPTSSPHPNRPPSSATRQSIDDSNALTFAGGTVSGGRGSGSGGGGWSAEEMFALNEAKYGVRSSVVEEKLEEPEGIDEIMRSVMGPKYRGGGGRGGSRGDKERGGKHRSARSEQLPNHPHSGQSPSNSPAPLPPLPEQSTIATAAGAQPPQSVRGRGFRGRGRGNTRSTLPLPGTSSSTGPTTTAPALNVEELDFSHNPYQSRTLAVSTTSSSPASPSPLHSAAGQSPASSVLPSPASFSQLSAKSAATPTTQPQATNGSSAVPPYSARASDKVGGGKAGPSTFSEFRFDLDSILQPLSATKLD